MDPRAWLGVRVRVSVRVRVRVSAEELAASPLVAAADARAEPLCAELAHVQRGAGRGELPREGGPRAEVVPRSELRLVRVRVRVRARVRARARARVVVRTERRTGVRTEVVPRASLVLASARAGLLRVKVRNGVRVRFRVRVSTRVRREAGGVGGVGGVRVCAGAGGCECGGGGGGGLQECSGAREADDRASTGRGGKLLWHEEGELLLHLGRVRVRVRS